MTKPLTHIAHLYCHIHFSLPDVDQGLIGHLLCFILAEIITALTHSIQFLFMWYFATVEAGEEPAQGVTFPQPAFILNVTLYDPVQK